MKLFERYFTFKLNYTYRELTHRESHEKFAFTNCVMFISLKSKKIQKWQKFLSFVLIVLGRLKKKFQYRVKVPKAETLFLAMETESKNESSGWSCSRLTRDDFQLNIVDQCGETAFTMVMNSMWTFALNKSHVSKIQTVYKIIK